MRIATITRTVPQGLRRILFVVVMLAVAVLPRLLWASIAPLGSDEGWWLLGAKNMLLHKVWTLRYYETLSQSPVSTYLLYLWQAVAGIGILRGRVLMLALALWQLLAYFLLVRARSGALAALVSLALVALLFPVLSLSAMVYTEPLVMSFSLAALLLANSKRRWARLASAICVALAVGTKVTEMWVLPVAMALAFSSSPAPVAERRRDALIMVVASLVLAAATYGISYVTQPETFWLTWHRYYVYEFQSRTHNLGGSLASLLWIGKQVLPGLPAAAAALYAAARSFRAQGSGKHYHDIGPPALWLAATSLTSCAFSGGRHWRLYAVFWPLCWLIAAGIGMLREHAPVQRPLRRLVALAYVAGTLSWFGVLSARQILAAPKTVADELAICAWASQHVQPGERVLAAAYLGANLASPAYDLYDIAIPDRQGRALPVYQEFYSAVAGDWQASASQLLHDLDVTWVVVDDREWMTWAERLGYADELEGFLDSNAVEIISLPGAQVWRYPEPASSPALQDGSGSGAK